MNAKFLYGTSDILIAHKDEIENGSFIFLRDTKKLYIKFDGIITSVTRGIKYRTNCVNCGGILSQPENEYSAVTKCPYCGTIQDIDDNIDLGILKSDDSEEEIDNI